MMQLSPNTLEKINSCVDSVTYDRSATSIGIVHLGPGGFHRGHQAVYTDQLLRQGVKNVAISAISVNSCDVRDALYSQDNLYTLAILDKVTKYKIIGSIKEILVAKESLLTAIDRLSDPAITTVTMTITEKGYCLGPDGHLDMTNKSILHDIVNPTQPCSAIGLLLAGLKARYSVGVAPFIAISCDNLTENGKKLNNALVELASEWDKDFARWVSGEVHCPSTMVDSITPTTDQQAQQSISEAIGVQDYWPIQRETYTQWVIEDLPGQKLPPWTDVGVTISNDVHAYETAKLRILNGLHTTLTFVGIHAGYGTVGEVVSAEYMRQFLWDTFAEEIAPNIPCIPGLDLIDYTHQILKRFENPAITYTLEQIAWDSSQKIPFRLLGSIQDNLNAGRKSPRLCLAVAGWMRFVDKKTAAGKQLTDPLSETLERLVSATPKNMANVNYLLGVKEVFDENLANNPWFRADVTRAYSHLIQNDILDISRFLNQIKL